MTCNELSNLIIQNHDSIAFLVGNGIHNYEFGVKSVKGKLSWTGLLEKIKSVHGVSSLREKPQEGITNPEYFDLIELLYIQQQTIKEKNEFQKSIKSCIESIENLKQPNLNFLSQSYRVRTEKGNAGCSTSLFVKNDSLVKTESLIKERVLSMHDDFGFPHGKDIATYDQQIFAMRLLYGEERKFYIVKRNIKEFFKNYSLQDWILPLLLFASKEQIPIMTTNYDEALSKKLNLTRHCKIGNSDSQFTYPFETYFSKTDIEWPWKEFAIWHINGMVSYPQSIKIGYLDYAKMFNAIRERLFVPHGPAEMFSLIIKKDNLCKTWISIFFYRNLFIWGIGLNEDEYVLRWLLVERARYNLLTHKNLKGWYVHLVDKDKPMSDGKKIFLNTVGIEIIEVNSHDLHESVWKQIMSEI